MIKKIFYLLFLIFFVKCSKKEEPVAVCSPLPTYKDIDLLDKISGENVFSSGRFTKNQLQIITNPVNQFPIVFRENSNVFTIYPGENLGIIDFSIVLNNQVTIPLTTNIFLSDDGICGKFYRFEYITSLDPSVVIVKNIDNIKIKI